MIDVRARSEHSRLVRVGAKVVVFSAAGIALTWLVGWWHLRGKNGGMEDLGIAIGYGLVIVALTIIALVGLMLMVGGGIRSKWRARSDRG